ncbi:hypothetical protein GUITHDRAFT_112202 [Guillardia theta CCMP2712]|uniref:Uncharacterized protein n=1 Tax=Guillardia theta (strain CCMP2712) TaxID=905079 RepID=L1J0H0_GUITC|nr:hypothetical protein GUITHDRAFT_112202 [Guillardia theta CCMP2712]EKX41782.1 hypothetical protein GUITHDRAFT_112202 [Guillardia theta CCMP2712]|eukprot:XP_005828762.1 hypothetical protein GUITHDRAFT_112202 [Guillardia theta CCMP2712]
MHGTCSIRHMALLLLFFLFLRPTINTRDMNRERFMAACRAGPLKGLLRMRGGNPFFAQSSGEGRRTNRTSEADGMKERMDLLGKLNLRVEDFVSKSRAAAEAWDPSVVGCVPDIDSLGEEVKNHRKPSGRYVYPRSAMPPPSDEPSHSRMRSAVEGITLDDPPVSIQVQVCPLF